jgi:hypothetical protein
MSLPPAFHESLPCESPSRLPGHLSPRTRTIPHEQKKKLNNNCRYRPRTHPRRPRRRPRTHQRRTTILYPSSTTLHNRRSRSILLPRHHRRTRPRRKPNPPPTTHPIALRSPGDPCHRRRPRAPPPGPQQGLRLGRVPLHPQAEPRAPGQVRQECVAHRQLSSRRRAETVGEGAGGHKARD